MASLSDFGKFACYYCGKPSKIEDAHVIDGIMCCDGCYVKMANKEEPGFSLNLTPKDIYNHLSRLIYGQDSAKKKLSNAGYLHLQRISGKLEGVDKTNVLLIGGTGTGKTYLVNTLADILQVPFVSISATALTENGYVGADVESAIRRLEVAAGGNRERAEKGIVFIDEVDKLSGASSKTVSGSTVIGREGVQQALLKIIEGNIVDLSEHGNGTDMIDTTNILFVCAGAFDGINDIIERRKNHAASMGFGGNIVEKGDAVLEEITVDDLCEFGMSREFIARLPSVAIMEDVTVDFLKEVLKLDNSVLKQYERIFEAEGVELVVNDEELSAIAEEAYLKGTGCRGLRNVCDVLFEDIIFNIREIKGKKISINGEVIKNKL